MSELPESASRNRFKQLRRNLSLQRLKALSKSSTNRGIERYRRAGITASSSFIGKALNILISFLSVPLTVHYLGAERYGVWLTISSLITWMSMTDFGLAGVALVNVLSEAHGKDDRVAAQQYTASAWWSLTGVSVLAGILSVSFFRYIPWRTVFRVSTATSTHELQMACALTLLFFVIGFPLSVQMSIYNAYQDGYLANVWSISGNALSLVALIVVSQTHGGLPQLVLALSGTRCLVSIANIFFLFRRYHWITPVPSAVRWHCVKRLFKLGSKYLVSQLASLGIYQSQPMIITQLLGPAKVVIFVVAYKIISLPMDLVYMATQPFVPAFGEAKARHDWGWIRSAYRNCVKASLTFGLPMVAVIALTAKPLIRIWAGAAAIPSYSLVIWLSIYTLIGVILMAAGQLMSGVERVDPLAISITLCAIGVVSSGILLSPRWGLTGIAFGMAMSKLVTFWPIQIREVRRILRFADATVVEQVANPVA
ncbi:MAG TPA: oligosaccharide flippase family protein [Acidobacteriaceae bacterium]|nr:oligosaccharide flippase family protein [Acidobacteriaceae bacterium]